MDREFCEKTIECIESLTKKVELLEEASRISSDMMKILNKEIIRLRN
tara:strand:- start:606 stop:746 length:141 start_codon:yes stop_codon:yes gene_type:complete